MHVPTAVCSSTLAARAVAEAARGTDRALLTCWLGRETVGEAWKVFEEAGLPTYPTPERAVRAFLHRVDYRRNQDALLEVPPAAACERTREAATARATIERALAGGRSLLTEPEAKSVLSAYGIPVIETRTATTGEEAARLAGEIGFPVALKLASPDVSHKSDVGGVALDLASSDAVRRAAEAMAERLASERPDARLGGFSVQRMARRAGARELIIGVTSDATFGPVILFGEGGTAVEAIGDRAVALPPLNINLARELIGRTRIQRLLRSPRGGAPLALESIERALVQVSQLIVDLPEVVELDINPLLARDDGIVALDARMVVERAAGSGADRLAIRPYPRELEERVTLASGRSLLVRPIRPEDEPAHHALISRLAPEDVRFRFFGLVRRFPHGEMARFTQIDYDREMAFVATTEEAEPETLGVVRAVSHPADAGADFAILVRSDIQGQGLGRLLLEKMVRYCRERGLRELRGQVLEDNRAMLALAKRLGFQRGPVVEGVVDIRLSLAEPRCEGHPARDG